MAIRVSTWVLNTHALALFLPRLDGNRRGQLNHLWVCSGQKVNKCIQNVYIHIHKCFVCVTMSLNRPVNALNMLCRQQRHWVSILQAFGQQVSLSLNSQTHFSKKWSERMRMLWLGRFFVGRFPEKRVFTHAGAGSSSASLGYALQAVFQMRREAPEEESTHKCGRAKR